jgi:hypothetical protein
MWAVGGTLGASPRLLAFPDYTAGRTDEHDPIELTTGQSTVTGGKGTEPLSAVQIRGIMAGSPPLLGRPESRSLPRPPACGRELTRQPKIPNGRRP